MDQKFRPMDQKYEKPYLISVKFLEKVDNSTIARFVNDGLRELIEPEKLLLLVTDGVAYMKAAGRALSVFYLNMIHVTCMCHALHRVSEDIRTRLPDVDDLVNNTKKVFRKAPSRVAKFHEMCPDISLPPKPVLTRWGTWIDASNYYCSYYDEVKAVVHTFDPDDADCILKSQRAFNSTTVKQSLALIKTNYSILPKSIKRLEEQGLKLNESLAILQEVKEELEWIPGEIGNAVNIKLEQVIAKNKGLEKLMAINRVLIGEKQDDIGMNPDVIAAYKYAQIQSCDVERSFSIYKRILEDKRTSLTEENIEKLMICNCYYTE
ncbi:hypothetical protein DdX_14334 [Ditylenchus destructor]|uniref:DUF659 domain-containing protein n=1 Tax=Ditylenchus destructor TaxID=166010 RepID=A0AAD4MRB9_9BILA|nr:hypothetical protein DdX_14334 [Ditylenchus destructor]